MIKKIDSNLIICILISKWKFLFGNPIGELAVPLTNPFPTTKAKNFLQIMSHILFRKKIISWEASPVCVINFQIYKNVKKKFLTLPHKATISIYSSSLLYSILHLTTNVQSNKSSGGYKPPLNPAFKITNQNEPTTILMVENNFPSKPFSIHF